jgi:hypothetical protein
MINPESEKPITKQPYDDDRRIEGLPVREWISKKTGMSPEELDEMYERLEDQTGDILRDLLFGDSTEGDKNNS